MIRIQFMSTNGLLISLYILCIENRSQQLVNYFYININIFLLLLFIII